MFDVGDGASGGVDHKVFGEFYDGGDWLDISHWENTKVDSAHSRQYLRLLCLKLAAVSIICSKTVAWYRCGKWNTPRIPQRTVYGEDMMTDCAGEISRRFRVYIKDSG